MNIITGQGLLLKINFADGGICNSRRTFLVYDLDLANNKIYLLNVSSIPGKKTSKLLLPSNERIIKHYPPFDKKSMVKLDAIYEIEYFSDLDNTVLASGNPLDVGEFNSILGKLESYKASGKSQLHASYTEQEIREINTF